jgi:hypothetical protein
MTRAAGLVLCFTLSVLAHENGKKNTKPTAAQKDLDDARRLLHLAKKELSATGKYSCCVKPGCDLCPMTRGACSCAEQARSGRGVCGECLGGWKAGRGSVKGISAKSMKLEAAKPAEITGPPDLLQAAAALLRAKRILVAEQRYACCIRGGCGQCAHEAECPCARDLGAAPDAKGRRKGVCGRCLNGWQAGEGRLAGISLDEVTLAEMGTAPMEMLSTGAGPWTLSLHGSAFGIYTAQSGPSGREKIFSTNFVAPEASRPLGPGTLTVHSMFSLEPATITNRQYPLLFQEGETAFGVPIVNGQHPHSFFMELAASYRIRLGERASLNFYGGPRGEPALGPTAYMHRISASENPIAPLGHHQQDSTHVATDVITAGFTYGPVTLEASGFHGREPGELRWGLEQGAIDSFSTRVTVAPTSRWSAQFSAGRLKSAEVVHALRPDLRTTASLLYVRPLASGGHWATTWLWGRNVDLSYTQLPGLPVVPHALRPLHVVTVPTRIPPYTYNSYLFESTLFFHRTHWLWGRAENADRDSLLLYQQTPLLLLIDERRYARVQAYTGGYEYELPRALPWLATGIGGQITLFHAPPNLAPVFDANPVGVQLFLRMRVGSVSSSALGAHH